MYKDIFQPSFTSPITVFSWTTSTRPPSQKRSTDLMNSSLFKNFAAIAGFSFGIPAEIRFSNLDN